MRNDSKFEAGRNKGYAEGFAAARVQFEHEIKSLRETAAERQYRINSKQAMDERSMEYYMEYHTRLNAD